MALAHTLLLINMPWPIGVKCFDLTMFRHKTIIYVIAQILKMPYEDRVVSKSVQSRVLSVYGTRPSRSHMPGKFGYSTKKLQAAPH